MAVRSEGAESFAKRRVARIGPLLRLLLGVEVIEVAEKFIEAMHGRQIFVSIAKMIFAELAGRIANWLEQFGDCRVSRLKTHCGGRHAHF